VKIIEKSKSFYPEFERKGGPHKETTHYCPGCGHGNVHKMIAECMDDLGIKDRTVFVSPVGCSVFGYYYFDCGNFQAAHGRAPAVATGIKRANPDSIVISYQGDGDLAAIGTAETIHAANRGENITVFFVNNAIYGMTGGQMAPTTMIGQKTTTTPRGRIENQHGNPIRVAEIMATLPAASYVERVAIGTSKHIMKARKAIRKALQNQVDNKGYSFVEILSCCPTGWKMDGPDARDWLLEEMTKIFPLGVYKDEADERENEWYRPVEPFDPAKRDAYLGADAEDDAVETMSLKTDLNCKFAGFGGQGILTLGLFLAQVGMRNGLHASWIPAYGPEMRGGTANCSVNISEKQIGSPLVEKPNALVVMNKPSLEMFKNDVVEGGTIIIDSSVIEECPVIEGRNVLMIPATKIADEVGTPKVANVVILGALAAATGAFTLEQVEKTLKATIKKKNLIDMNMVALKRGWDHVTNGG